MASMTTQTALPVLSDLGAVLIGERAALLENETGGKAGLMQSGGASPRPLPVDDAATSE